MACVAAPGQEGRSLGATEGEADLIQTEQRLAERYDRLEMLAGRLAELSHTTQPRRAQLLRELITRSRERDVPGQFNAISDLLDQRRYSSAVEQQSVLQKDLQALLQLLLQEDRDRQIESERKRIARYLQDLKRLIRLQRGVRARTDGGDDANRLAQDQQRVGEEAGKLRDEIEATERHDKQAETGEPSEAASDGEPRQPGDDSPTEGKPENASGSSKSGDQGSPPQSGGSGEPSQNSQSDGSSDSEQPPEEPIDRAAENLQQARQRMQAALDQLEKSKREGALQQQQEAINELEQAKAELERILRQLREEELERMLVSLESRFRRMLDVQVEIYEETQKLDNAAESTPAHEIEIAAGRQSRKERQLVGEADRAMLLLRDDGTSVAFPEALEQIRQDMQSIAELLLQVRVGVITQGLEEDVIEALEEALAVLQKSLEDLREQRAQQAQQSGGGEPGDQPLVDALEELRMIRGLQVRVNRRTENYGRLIDSEQAYDEELLRALDILSQRQQRIWRATRDLDTGDNR